jgi:hypothetical protein
MRGHTSAFLAAEILRLYNLMGPGGRELTDNEKDQLQDYSIELAERALGSRRETPQ